MAAAKHSRVQFAYQPGGPYPTHCGYCHGPNDSFVAEGIWAEDMTAQDFLDIVDRGCQRSGKFVYLPCNKVTCCPQYVMRLDSSSFRISKQQRRVIRRFKEYLETGHVSGMPDTGVENSPPSVTTSEVQEEDGEGRNDMERTDNNGGSSTLPDSGQAPVDTGTTDTVASPKKKPKKEFKHGSGPNPDLPKCRKAKLVRQEKNAKKKQLSQSSPNETETLKMTSPSPVPMDTQLPPQKQKTDVSSEISLPTNQDNWKHKFTVKLVCVNPASEEYRQTFDQSYQVFRKFQMTIHKEPEEKCQEEQFSQFCVDSPLILELSNLPGVAYGSYHQQYWIDDTLVMVGVLDILPQGVLCNYLYYDPYYRFLAPGVFSALYEIAQTQEYSRIDPRMQYYYMGYYVHDCPKMNYKRFYDSSYILCPETFQYVLLPHCKEKLDKNKYCRFVDAVEKKEVSAVESQQGEEDSKKESNFDSDLGQVLVFNYSYNEVMRYKDFVAASGGRFNDLIRKYVDVVGAELAGRMVLYIHGLVPMMM